MASAVPVFVAIGAWGRVLAGDGGDQQSAPSCSSAAAKKMGLEGAFRAESCEPEHLRGGGTWSTVSRELAPATRRCAPGSAA